MANKMMCIFGALGLTFAILCLIASSSSALEWPGCSPGPYKDMDRYPAKGEAMMTAALVLLIISMLLAITCIILFPIAWCCCEKSVCMMISLLIITAHMTIFLLYILINMALWADDSRARCASPEGPLAMTILAFLFAINCEVCACIMMMVACKCC